jgi:hypothetical protein
VVLPLEQTPANYVRSFVFANDSSARTEAVSSGSATSLGIDIEEVASVLDGFPSLFRRGTGLSPTTAQVSSTLHARYAGRRINDPDPARSERQSESRPLDPEHQCTSVVHHEQSEPRAARRATSTTRIRTLVGVGIAAVASVLAAVISAAT